MKKIISGLATFFLPSALACMILKLLGYKVSMGAKIGFSFIACDSLELHRSSRIGSFNLLRCSKLTLRDKSYIGRMNVIKGPFEIFLEDTAAIGNTNVILKPRLGISSGITKLHLGILAKITANHRLDLTRNITMGNYTTIAGSNSQLWTHGYYHYPEGPDRFRVDGDIRIGDNVYIGSRVVINAGIIIADGVVVGSNACVSRSLLERGMYVSQPLRMVPLIHEEMLTKFRKDSNPVLIENVFVKDI